MRRFLLPIRGLLPRGRASLPHRRTTPRPERTDPPAPPPASEYRDTVAAAGVIEASTENIAVGVPLSAIVPKVFVAAGDAVRAGDPLFELDTRHLRAELAVRRQAL